MNLSILNTAVGSIKHIIDELPSNLEKNEVRKFINEYLCEIVINCMNCTHSHLPPHREPCKSCEDFDKFENGKQSDSICGTSKY
jgi:hypothetical protein